MANGTAILRPDFIHNYTKYVHVSEKIAELYKSIYDENLDNFSTLLEMFNFNMIVYDETEYFRKAGDPLFYYPFSN